MDRQKVTKDPKRQETARKGRENYLNKLKESILNDAEKGSEDISYASNDATYVANSATTTATSATTKSNDTYIYDIGIVVLVAIAVCVFFAYNKKLSQAANKVQDNEEPPIKPPKRRNMP